ncbi:Cro/CI family transcriptional regulator [Pantoea allii]|uniref:Cro/CI family transcriptional regulator n=1 Tax=Pantoea allii TaxID=574096 RepID=UPI003D30F1DE
MLKDSVLKFYGGPTKTALALGISHSAVSQWGKVIPEKQAFVINLLTDGKLTYDQKFYSKNNPVKSKL